MPKEVLIDELKIRGRNKALAILSGLSFPVKKLAKYLNKKGLMLYEESLLARSTAPPIWLLTISSLKKRLALAIIRILCSLSISSIFEYCKYRNMFSYACSLIDLIFINN